jgi:nitrogen fixation protein NifZ
MIEPAVPKYQWGQRVQAVIDLRNDGSYPECAADELLAAVGDVGEVVQVGTHVDSNTPVYVVEFGPKRVVGCLENEISLVP